MILPGTPLISRAASSMRSPSCVGTRESAEWFQNSPTRLFANSWLDTTECSTTTAKEDASRSSRSITEPGCSATTRVKATDQPKARPGSAPNGEGPEARAIQALIGSGGRI